MFQPNNTKLKVIAEAQPQRIEELERIFSKSTNIYIDYANVRPWANHLKWHVDLKRLGQLLESFTSVGIRKAYLGTLIGDRDSEALIKRARSAGFDVVTKRVKIMKLSIDVSSVAPNSPDILKSFIRSSLLKQLRLETVQYLNDRLRELNQAGQLEVEDRKCNFDVEIGRDMLLDYAQDNCETFVLWSGDSDFADPIRQLLKDGKRVYLFATARRVARELNALSADGLQIYDIQKHRDFICWRRELADGDQMAA